MNQAVLLFYMYILHVTKTKKSQLWNFWSNERSKYFTNCKEKCSDERLLEKWRTRFENLKKLSLPYNACFRSTSVKLKTHISSVTNKTFNEGRRKRVKRNRQTWSKVVVGFTLTVCRRAFEQRTATLLQAAILDLWWGQHFFPLSTGL